MSFVGSRAMCLHASELAFHLSNGSSSSYLFLSCRDVLPHIYLPGVFFFVSFRSSILFELTKKFVTERREKNLYYNEFQVI